MHIKENIYKAEGRKMVSIIYYFFEAEKINSSKLQS